MFFVIETNVSCRSRPDPTLPSSEFHLPPGVQFTFNETVQSNGTTWYGNLYGQACWVPASAVIPNSSSFGTVLAAIAERILNRVGATFDDYVEVDNRFDSYWCQRADAASPLLQLRRLQIIDKATGAANLAGQAYSRATHTEPTIIRL